MLKQISILLLIGLSNLYISAQTEKYSAPVKWERYKVSDKSVSILLPKLPVLIQSSDICNEVETYQYAAYADETVYGLTIVSKNREKAPDYCSPKKKFDEKNFENRLTELKNSLEVSDEMKIKQNNLEIIKVKNVTRRYTYWLINDFDNKRWFEFWIAGADEEKPDVKSFIESVKIDNTAQGIEIDKGSFRTLGDGNIANNPADSDKKDSGIMQTESLRIVLKPRPNYTDAARQSQVQGMVRLKVTFLANGGIGSIAIVSGLPYGLAEQAIAAAGKIVFLPAKKNRTTYSVTKIVEYNFSIY